MQEINLALLRNENTTAKDRKQFMNDGEWELLSIPSRYRLSQQNEIEYAYIQFNVRDLSYLAYIHHIYCYWE